MLIPFKCRYSKSKWTLNDVKTQFGIATLEDIFRDIGITSSPVESERDHGNEEDDEDHGGSDDDGEADHDGGPRGPRPWPGLLPHGGHQDTVTVPGDHQAVRLVKRKYRYNAFTGMKYDALAQTKSASEVPS